MGKIPKESRKSPADAVNAFFGTGFLELSKQASQRLAGVAPEVRHTSTYSAADAVSAYLEYMAQHRKSVVDARSRRTAYVIPYFGSRSLSSLTPADFKSWSQWAFDHDPRTNSGGRAPMSATEEKRRRTSHHRQPTCSGGV